MPEVLSRQGVVRLTRRDEFNLSSVWKLDVLILDAILIGSVSDARYANRRDRMVLATVACSACDEACFCTSMGYGPHDPTGSDVLFLPLGSDFLVRSITPKGRRFLGELGIDADEGGEPDEPPELRRHIETGVKS